MVKIEDILKDIINSIKRLKIPYMLVGGMAVGFYGEPRFTKDIDIVFAITPPDVEGLIKILKKQKYKFDKLEIETLVNVSNRFTIADPSDTYRIDFGLPKTNYEIKAFKRRKRKKIDKTTLQLITPEDLVLFKLLADRPQDIIDIEGILQRQRGRLDRKYLKYWALALNKDKKLKELIK